MPSEIYIGKKLSHLVKIPLVARYSKMQGLYHGGQSFILILTKGDGNCQALKDIEVNCPEEEYLIVEFIEPCQASIYYTPDVEVNGPLKKMTREEHHYHVAKLFSASKQSANNIEVEDNFLVS